MKIKLVLLLLLWFSGYSQKKYSFDYKIIYEFKLNDTAKAKEIVLMTNSKDNSYRLNISEKDSANYSVNFHDENGIESTVFLNKNSFNKATAIELKCEFVSGYSNPYKYQTKNYEFINKEYALMDGQYHPFYILKSNNPKKEKKKRLATFYYYIENNTEFHLPILVHPTAYEEWKLEKNIPNGIPKEMFYSGYGKAELFNILKLKEIIKIEKFIVIPEECNYIELKSRIKIN